MRSVGNVSVLVLLVLLMARLVQAGDYYLDADKGLDSNDGKTPATAWQTIARVHAAKMTSGDRVLFHRGQVWRARLVCSKGEPGNPVVYTAYGEGEKPLLLGSFSLAQPDLWTRCEGDTPLWATPAHGQAPNLFDDVGNIILTRSGETERTAAFKKWSLDQLTDDEDFFYNYETRQVFYRSETNPGERYDEMEAALRDDVIRCQQSVVIDGLAVSCGASHGVSAPDAHDCIVRNCDFSWIGGGNLYRNDRNVRYGNGVEFWTSASDCLVENCHFEEIYDVAMTNQGDGVCEVRNIVWRNNTTIRCEQGYETWFSDPATVVEGVVFEHNTCLDCGFGWGHRQRPNKCGTALLSYSMEARVFKIRFHDNLFSNSTESLIRFYNNRLNECESDNNVWRHPGLEGKPGIESPLFMWLDKDWIAVPFEEYRQRMGNDANSKFEEM